MTPFQSLPEYETFVYTLPQQFPSILRSTLIVARRGRLLAELSGELAFAGGHRLVVYERLSWDAGPWPSKATATRFGVAARNGIGMIRSPTQTIQRCPALIFIINTSHLTSGTTASLPLV